MFKIKECRKIMKKCTQCNEVKLLSLFSKRKDAKDGRKNQCKSCINLKKRKTPIKPKPKEGFKYCASCNMELSLENFNIRTVLGKKKPFSYCKKCERDLNNNRYSHTCKECGKQYKSGRKEATFCKECDNKKVGIRGAEVLNNLDWSGLNNPMYGVSRYEKNNPNYNLNKTDEERAAQRCLEGYEHWRVSVFNRDNYSCVCCGNKGGNLNAHHLDGYHWCKEKRTDINNGVTLCESCHKEFHKQYSNNNNTKEQFINFMMNKLKKYLIP